MSNQNQLGAVITGIGHYLPERALSSQEIAARVTTESVSFHMPDGLIERLTGVIHRHHATLECSSSDLATYAAQDALQNAHLSPKSIDVMIFAAASQDISEPATANIVQEKVGCINAHVFDVKNACNSFLNALDIANALIETQRARYVLITTGEVLSPVINWQVDDIQDLPLKFAGLTLGDGGGACVIGSTTDAGRGLLPGHFLSDGSQWRLSTVLSGGTLMKEDMSKFYFECDSATLQSVAIKYIPLLAVSCHLF